MSCSNKLCTFLNAPQAASGTFNCTYIFKNSEKCMGTYKVTDERATAAVRFIKEREKQEILAKMAMEREKRRTPSSMYNAQIKKRPSRSVFTNRKSRMTRKDFSNYLKTKPLPEIPSHPSQLPATSMTSTVMPSKPARPPLGLSFSHVEMHCYFPKDNFTHSQQFCFQYGPLPSTQFVTSVPPMKIARQHITTTYVPQVIPQGGAQSTW